MNISYMAIPGLPRGIAKDIDRIIKVVGEVFCLSRESLFAKCRKRNLAEARHICMYFIKKNTHLTFKEISIRMGHTHHTTAVHAVNNVTNLIAVDSRVRHLVEKIESIL